VAKEPDNKEKKEPVRNRLQKIAAVLLLALIAFVGIDGYFNSWGTIRSLAALNTLELRDKSGHSWDLVAKKDFQLVSIKDVRNVLSPDSLFAFDRQYREDGFYRLYFRTSDSASAKLQKMYQTLQAVDSGQTIKRTIEDAERAYQNLQRILRFNRPELRDSVSRIPADSTAKFSKSDLDLGSGDEAASVIKKFASNPQVIVGLGIGIVASAAIDLLRGDAYVALSKGNVFRLDSINVGTRVGTWEGSPIDILWVFAKQDTVGEKKQTNQARDSTTVDHDEKEK
jgi:hypothetical protein